MLTGCVCVSFSVNLYACEVVCIWEYRLWVGGKESFSPGLTQDFRDGLACCPHSEGEGSVIDLRIVFVSVCAHIVHKLCLEAG